MDKCIHQLEFNNTVIRPPPEQLKNYRKITVDVNSSSRNYTTYATPNQYVYYLNQSISNIMEIELASINLPNSLYNVNNNNNKLYFAQNVNVATSYEPSGLAIRDNTKFLLCANMPTGNYKICISDTTNLVSSDDFASNLETVLNANMTPNFTTTMNVNTNKYQIHPTTILANNTSVLYFNTNKKEDVIMNAGTASQHNKLLSNSIGELVGMTRTYSPFITGNVSTTASNATVTGLGTSFLKDLTHLVADDQVTIVNADIGGSAVLETLQIATIDTDTQLTLKSSTLPGLSRSNCEIAPVKFIGNAQHNIDGDDVVYLHIAEFNKLEANRTGAQDAFCKINMNKGTVERIGAHTNLKQSTNNLEKKLERINKLTIKFTDINGNIVDFNGREHNFTLIFNCLTQQQGYSF
jgi:hypothetical protein